MLQMPDLEPGRIGTRRSTSGIFYENCYARDILHFVRNICLEQLTKFHPAPSTAVVAQWVRRWTTDRRVVQLVGSRPPEDVFQTRFNNYFYLSFMLGQVYFSDIAQQRPAFQAASDFFETNREVHACFFQNCRRFLQFKTSTPGQRKLGEKPSPKQWERANPRGEVRLGID